MRVAMVITRFGGGRGLLALHGALALDRAEYEPVLLTRGGELCAQAQAAGLRVVTLPPGLGPLTAALREGRYDLVHTFDPGLGPRTAVARAGIGRSVHTWDEPDPQTWPVRQARLALERLVCRRVDALLAVGSGTASRALRLGLAGPDRVRICRPVVDLGMEPEQARWARARRRLDLPLGVRVVGAVGVLTRAKGPDVFVRALARLPGDVHGLWAGDGPLRDRLERLTEKLGLTERMRWLGHRDDLSDLLPGFDVLAVPSRWSGLPLALLEGVAAGIPVVASALPALDEVVLARETGLLVAPGDPKELARTLTWILDRPEIAQEMAINARNVVEFQQRYSGSRLGAVLADVYRDARA